MTKQQDYSQFSKAEAIKEIEKLTDTTISNYNYKTKEYVFENSYNDKKISFTYFIDIRFTCDFEFRFEWFKPLSKLIPILFKNETEQSKTIKEGE